MQIVDLPVVHLVVAPWNPNTMAPGVLQLLRTSIQRFGTLLPLVVRRLSHERYEVIGGNHRLAVLEELGATRVPCIIVEMDDVQARLLAQALNRIHGEDDLGMRAELLRTVLEHLPAEEVLSVVPETAKSLNALASLGKRDVVDYLRQWEATRSARLRHFTAQLTAAQSEVVDSVLNQFLEQVKAGEGGNPNPKGIALFQLCLAYLDLRKETD